MITLQERKGEGVKPAPEPKFTVKLKHHSKCIIYLLCCLIFHFITGYSPIIMEATVKLTIPQFFLLFSLPPDQNALPPDSHCF